MPPKEMSSTDLGGCVSRKWKTAFNGFMAMVLAGETYGVGVTTRCGPTIQSFLPSPSYQSWKYLFVSGAKGLVDVMKAASAS